VVAAAEAARRQAEAQAQAADRARRHTGKWARGTGCAGGCRGRGCENCCMGRATKFEWSCCRCRNSSSVYCSGK
jgi:hypothetical protein